MKDFAIQVAYSFISTKPFLYDSFTILTIFLGEREGRGGRMSFRLIFLFVIPGALKWYINKCKFGKNFSVNNGSVLIAKLAPTFEIDRPTVDCDFHKI